MSASVGGPTIAQRIAAELMSFHFENLATYLSTGRAGMMAKVVAGALRIPEDAVGEVVVVTPELQALMKAAKEWTSARNVGGGTWVALADQDDARNALCRKAEAFATAAGGS